MLKRASLWTALVLMSCVSSAQAHFIWLEREGGGPVKAYFGEWADDVRERSDGLLGKVLSNPKVSAADGAALTADRKGADFVEFKAHGKGDVRLQQQFLYKETLVEYGAKAGRHDTRAQLDLELVPESAGSNAFVLKFQGQPLANTEVVVFGPPKWEKRFRTDATGKTEIQTPWPGQYVVETAHVVDQPGDAGGQRYTKIRYVSTLTFNVAK